MTTATASPARPLSARAMAYAPILLVVGLGAALRIAEIFQPYIDVFSWRQASTAMMADNFYRDSWNIFFPAVSWNGPDPAYTGREFQTVSYLAALGYTVVGQKDWVGRLISVSASLWGIFALYGLTRRVWDEPRALATALMYAVLPGAVFIDRSFLPDGTMLALTITACWLYVAHLQNGRRSVLVLAAIVSAAAFLTKLPGIIALVPMGYATVAILRARGELRWPALRPILLALVLVLIPVVAYYAWAVYLGTHYPPHHVAGSGNWVWKDGMAKWLGKGYYLNNAVTSFWWWIWTPPVIGLVMLGVLLAPPRAGSLEADDGRPRAPWLFHFWLLGCGVLYALGARELDENEWNYHVFNVFGAAMAGYGLAAIAGYAQQTRPRWEAAVRVGIVLAVVLWQGQVVLATLYQPTHSLAGWQMGKTIAKVAAPDDTVVTIADDVGDPIAIYYSRRRGWTFPPAHRQDVWKPWNLMPPPNVAIPLFDELRKEGADWLGIVKEPKDDAEDRSKRPFWKNHPELIAHIERTCELRLETPFCKIYRIRQVDSPTTAPSP